VTVVASELELVRAFNFRVKLVESPPAKGAKAQTLADGAFQECSGLEIELDIQELQEGGRNDGVIRRIGRAKYQPLVLKRGMFSPKRGGPAEIELWSWLQKLASRTEIVRYDGVVEVLDVSAANQTVVARWSFVRGLPLKVVGPQLHARTGEVAIEELHIAHEGLTLERLP
jgi:phage tail-like protein